MHLRFSNVQDGTADGIQITAPSDSPNTDGIHVSESSNIVIANCDITTGNDGIHVSESSNIVIANCDITTGNEKKNHIELFQV